MKVFIFLVIFAITSCVLTIIASNTTIVIQILIYYKIWEVEYYDASVHNTAWRKQLDGILDKPECANLIKVIRKHAISSPFVKTDLANTLSTVSQNDVSSFSDLVSRVQDRVVKIVQKQMNSTTLFLEFGDMTKRVPTTDWKYNAGHQAHVDNCGIRHDPFRPFQDLTCTYSPRQCCAWRTFSAVLYLNGPDSSDNPVEGGEFFLLNRRDVDPNMNTLLNDRVKNAATLFRNMVKVIPHCGRLVIFSSDMKNIHGTLPVLRGERFAMPFWFTSIEHLPKDTRLGNIDENWIVRLARKHIRRAVCTDYDDEKFCATRLEHAYRTHWPHVAVG